MAASTPISPLDLENVQFDTDIQIIKEEKLTTRLTSRYFGGVNLNRLHFHKTKGRNIAINVEKNLATRVETEFDKGYVFLDKSITINCRIVIQIVSTIAYPRGLAFGLTVCDPRMLHGSLMPSDSNELMDRPEYWVVLKDIAGKLCPLDELAFHVDDEGQVYMSKNGSPPCVIMHIDPTQIMWPFFDLHGNAEQMRLLGSCMVSLIWQQKSTPTTRCPPMNLTPVSMNLTPVSMSSIATSPMRVQELDECSVCFDNQVNCVIYTCGHMCLCYSCAKEQWAKQGNCPMCRRPIKDVIRTYKS